MSLGEILRERRKALGWSQAALGMKTKYTNGFISALESGAKLGSVDCWTRLGRILDVDFLGMPEMADQMQEALSRKAQIEAMRAKCAARRVELGITHSTLASRIGVGDLTVMNALSGWNRGNQDLWRRIGIALQIDLDIPDFLPEFQKAAPQQQENAVLKRWEFKEGGKYQINGTKLRFIRKEGRHHVFQSHAGWLTTWTDAQLAGEEVKEG